MNCAVAIRSPRRHVEFDHVWTEYEPGQPVLRDVDLAV
jgi:hypothetical protein